MQYFSLCVWLLSCFSLALWLFETIFSCLLLLCLPCPTEWKLYWEKDLSDTLSTSPYAWHMELKKIPADWMNQCITKRMAKLKERCAKERTRKCVLCRLILTQALEWYRLPTQIFRCIENIPPLLSVLCIVILKH